MHITRHDNSRQENRVMCGGLRHEVTRQDKTGLVVSDLTTLDTCDKARFLYCCVVDPRTLHDFLVWSCLVVSCNVRWALKGKKNCIDTWKCQNHTFNTLHHPIRLHYF